MQTTAYLPLRPFTDQQSSRAFSGVRSRPYYPKEGDAFPLTSVLHPHIASNSPHFRLVPVQCFQTAQFFPPCIRTVPSAHFPPCIRTSTSNQRTAAHKYNTTYHTSQPSDPAQNAAIPFPPDSLPIRLTAPPQPLSDGSVRARGLVIGAPRFLGSPWFLLLSAFSATFFLKAYHSKGRKTKREKNEDHKSLRPYGLEHAAV